MVDKPTQRIESHLNTCAGRSEWLEERSATFFAVEDYLAIPASVCPDHFESLVIVRDPVDRVHSHFRMIMETADIDKYRRFDHAHAYLPPQRCVCVRAARCVGLRALPPRSPPPPPRSPDTKLRLNTRFLAHQLPHVVDNMCVEGRAEKGAPRGWCCCWCC